MNHLLKSISCIAVLAFAVPALAQDDSAASDTETPESSAPDTTSDTGASGATGTEESSDAASDVVEPSGTDGLNMGTPEDAEQAPAQGPGSSYTAETFGDWQQRCVRAEEGPDPCQLYQLLRDAQGNAVAEMSVFPLPAGREAAAGSTIITPLETLLTRNVTIRVDDGQAKRYPFEFCAVQGCFARVGFTQAEVDQFKRGASGTLSIVPAAAPDQQINLTISLTGFTAGYEAVREANSPQ